MVNILSDGRALSSAVEHFLHTEGVAGSNPAARTILRSELTSGDSERRMVSSGLSIEALAKLEASAKEDSLVNSSELRMAGQFFQSVERRLPRRPVAPK